jgi:multiple sugar transport system ATP-binding protein
MHGGHIEQIGAPLDLYDRPANTFVAGFIGSPAMNLLKGRIANGSFETEGGASLPLPANAPAEAGVYGIRPEHVSLRPDGGIPAVVVLVEPTGSETQVLVRIGDTTLTCAFRERITARPGDVIGIQPDTNLVHLFDAGAGRRVN